ncbi:MAG TPA: 6-phosphofructokinase, partial [Anaerolineales bacterium]|nr:6-phosphofructokinase [Anaerolineales bacterium]
MRIGILTGGGDVPGLNPCIKAFVYRAIDEGHEVLGIRRGWGGLFYYNPDDPTCHEECVLPLDKQNTRTIDRTGGTILHTSRTNPSKIRAKQVPDFLRGEGFNEDEKDPLDFTPHVLRVIEHLGIEVLVPIGGDDTLGYGARLYEENFPIVAIPKTMDNDVFGTDYCIGFSTAVTRSVQFIHQLRTSIGSHERLGVIELFGRNSGETCLISSHLSGVDRAVISEVPFDPEKLASFLIEDRKDNPSNYAIMAISEGARFVGGKIVEYGQADAFGHKKLGGIGMLTSEALKEITG